MRDPYQVLGLGKGATKDEIKKAYRQLAKALHPDLHPGDKKVEARFKEISAAYHILSDDERRRRYDAGEIDAAGAERQRPFYRAYAGEDLGGRTGRTQGRQAFFEDVFSDLFGEAGRGRGTRGRARGADVSYTLRVSFLDAANGARKRLTLPEARALEVVIPEGLEDRQTLRLAGQGEPGAGGGPAGDAFVEVHIEPHAFFIRKDSNIHVEVPVTLAEAVLGGPITVPTISGPVTMKVPKGSNTGTTLRLKGKGVRDRRSDQRGDQYVQLKVVLPAKPDAQLTELVRKWAAKTDYDVRAHML